jgi:hypothetical protein
VSAVRTRPLSRSRPDRPGRSRFQQGDGHRRDTSSRASNRPSAWSTTASTAISDRRAPRTHRIGKESSRVRDRIDSSLRHDGRACPPPRADQDAGRLLLRMLAQLSAPVGPLVSRPRVVVGSRASCGGAAPRRDMDQVHPDPIPEDERPRIPSVRTSAGSRLGGRLGVAVLPALETAERLALRRRPAISMTGTSFRAVGVGREPPGVPWAACPGHSVGSPAFGSPAATAAARSAPPTGGRPPRRRDPSYSVFGRRARDGWTRGGSPACLA